MALTRRNFLKATAAAALVRPFASGASVPNSREPLQELPYSAVQLTGGPFALHYESIHAHYLSLSNDRLLKVYRQRAGLPAPGKDMGGWYDLNGFVPGHSLGQYISGLARIGSCTNDGACLQKVRELVGGFAETLGPSNKSILRPESNQWICYTLDKHFAGLIDAAALAGDSSAVPTLNRVLEGAEPLLPAKVHDRIGKKDPPYDEPYVMPENLFLAAAITNNPRFHELAVRYLLDDALFDPLAGGLDPFPGQHAYSHAIALSSAARAYLVLGKPKYKAAMQNAFSLLTSTQQFASGGWGPNETFVTPHRGELFDSLSTTVDHFETPCGSYAATKLARYLLRTSVPKSTEHADYLERVLFNAILAVRAPDSNGDYPYYSSYSAAAEKVFYASKWPCCSGTLVQTVADYPLNICLKSAAGIYLLLYTPSRVAFSHAGTDIQLEQKTDFPAQDTVTIDLRIKSPVSFALYLRLPNWLADEPASLAINGRSTRLNVPAGRFACLRRTWRNGDRIELTLPQTFRTEAIDDLHPHTVALIRGPVQYVAIEPSNERSRKEHRLLPSQLTRIAPEAFIQNDSTDRLVFVPLRSIVNETYTSYFRTG